MRHFRYYPIAKLPQRTKTSLVAVLKLLYFHPLYLFLALGLSILFYEIIFWFLNLGLAMYIFTNTDIGVTEKLDVIIGSYSGIFMQPFSSLAITLFIVSVLQGVSLAAIVYIIRKDAAMNSSLFKSIGGSGIAGIFSILGLGCAACGTSLVTPLLTFFFASSSLAASEIVGEVAAVIALIVSLISLYLSGYRLSAKLRV